MQKLTELFKQYSGSADFDVKALPSSGSSRKYFRFTSEDKSLIGVIGTSHDENKAFIYLSRHFKTKGLPVPEVYAVSPDGLYYLQEDLGETSLFDAIAEGRKVGNYSPEEVKLLKKAVATLPDFQYKGAESLDFSMCYPISDFDRQSIMFDLNYFKYCFLRLSGIEFDEVLLEKDFTRLCDRLEESSSDTFLYRDFQARNIMLRNGNPYFIDFQGGRRGPVQYDLASFVWQARAKYNRELRKELVDTYLEAASRYVTDKEDFLQKLELFVLFRTLQVLGAYGLRGLHERKQHFIDSIPYAVENIRELLEDTGRDFPYLGEVLSSIVEKYGTIKTAAAMKNEEHPVLNVRICSFSYKKGIPEDPSGNGGGYIFDCRGIPNPGRLPEYKALTGNDTAVVAYLEQFPETGRFKAATAELAELHIDNFLQRGFTNVMFCFGCTGGQHRSVYFANSLARDLRRKYDSISIRLIHREQGIDILLDSAENTPAL